MRKTVRWAVSASLLALCWALPTAAQPQVDHTVWDLLLKRHVVDGVVDYEGLRQDRTEFDRYIVNVQEANPWIWSDSDIQKAFMINAYNAFVVKGVLDHYPITSVKEVKGFFDRIRYRVGGLERTLNEMEADVRSWGDWRVHFALVCASSSCPLLRAEAYTADRLDAQLAEQTRQFLADPKRGVRVEPQILWLSKIFKWYARDFVADGRIETSSAIGLVIMAYLRPEHQRWLRQRHLRRVKFLDYDWSLNAQRK